MNIFKKITLFSLLVFSLLVFNFSNAENPYSLDGEEDLTGSVDLLWHGEDTDYKLVVLCNKYAYMSSADYLESTVCFENKKGFLLKEFDDIHKGRLRVNFGNFSGDLNLTFRLIRVYDDAEEEIVATKKIELESGENYGFNVDSDDDGDNGDSGVTYQYYGYENDTGDRYYYATDEEEEEKRDEIKYEYYTYNNKDDSRYYYEYEGPGKVGERKYKYYEYYTPGSNTNNQPSNTSNTEISPQQFLALIEAIAGKNSDAYRLVEFLVNAGLVE